MRWSSQCFIGIYLSIFLSGCSLPVGFSAASWVIDGASYIVTKKSLTDHGISFVAGQDCALYRLLTDMNVCHNYDDLIFSTIRKAEASELIENQISKYPVNEIYYSFYLSVHGENIAINDRLKFIQDHRRIAEKYGDLIYSNNDIHHF
jgi:hypothetical protein